MSTSAERKRNLGRVPVKWIVLACYVLLVFVSRWVTSADRQPSLELAHTVQIESATAAPSSGALPVVVVPSLPDHG